MLILYFLDNMTFRVSHISMLELNGLTICTWMGLKWEGSCAHQLIDQRSLMLVLVNFFPSKFANIDNPKFTYWVDKIKKSGNPRYNDPFSWCPCLNAFPSYFIDVQSLWLHRCGYLQLHLITYPSISHRIRSECR